MKKLKVSEPLKGFKYLYGDELAMVKGVQNICEKILKSKDFKEVVTPFLVDYSLIVGDENRPVSIAKSTIVFDFKSASREHIALRYENTFPVCKFYVENLSKNSKKIQKFFYISPQFRNEVVTDINSRLRQFYQVGWEIIGGRKRSYVIDSIKAGVDILRKLHIKHNVKISEVNIIAGIFEKIKITRGQRHKLLQIIDDRNLAELNTFIKALKLDQNQKDLIIKIATLHGDPEDTIRVIKPLLIKNGNFETVKLLKPLVKTYHKLRKAGCKDVEIDMSLVRSNKFYSGVFFQYYVGNNDHECGGGGEYNRVVKSLGGQNTNSSGGAFGFERLMYEYINKHE